MEKFNLACLPRCILHEILSKVATNHLRDFGSARIALPAFNLIGRDEYFYKSTDLIRLNVGIEEVHAVRTFRLKCQQAGNPQAIYLQDMYEYFVLHLLDEGRAKIRLAAERGFRLANYVDGMLDLAFSVDGRGLVSKYPSFGREWVDQMDPLIAASVISGNWLSVKPEVFMCLLQRIDPNAVSFQCRCSRIEQVFICDHCFWQRAAWEFCNVIYLTAYDWPI